MLRRPWWLGPLIILTLAGAAQASVAMAGGKSISFHMFENDFDGDTRLRTPRQMLNTAIPALTPTASAIVTMQRAGARCRIEPRHSQTIVCAYREQITVDDYYRANVVWTTQIHVANGLVRDIALSRGLDAY